MFARTGYNGQVILMEVDMRIEIFESRRLGIGPKQWHWRAVARNGRKIAGSLEGYSNRGDLLDTLALLRADFPSARLVSSETF